MQRTNDLHVVETRALMTPASLKAELPLSEKAANLVAETRDRIRKILRNEDERLLVIVGPCSVHDVNAALEYGKKLLPLREALGDKLEIVMRVYFEKPRTTTGWKGLINDPHLDNTYDINTGLRTARGLLRELAEMGMPCATELLDPITPQYIADLISWTAIGARTTESQTHREMASGLSMPVGFKNGTDGGFTIAIHAMLSASHPHHFLGINREGLASIVKTTGNADCHLVMRGGKGGPNYDRENLDSASSALSKNGQATRVMVDCSHGNTNKDYRRQPIVIQDLVEQAGQGSVNLMGVMIESHLVEGNQSLPKLDKIPEGKSVLDCLTYGQSVTDACVSFETTTEMLHSLATIVRSPIAV
ncbi:3-deoxy-7-phosphoheptulonate synthase [filamentous cyanobacterium LEGE 11480]|uniref:Phospho-2-dehydro-3-deoxyheptonate aldolase n=2 Tax=Romeriopsis TaxID=2992131 RepID=A0A928Z4C5_9CYAN|nr:3-deoxy-7-phosphoheptulonate synthase [Romeriopsis navalis LEGE 11480]